ncbi:MAG: trigger factor [Proteobacteria bacterium]|nr:MAG: trigger factor [Pseudomonadota bacterium]
MQVSVEATSSIERRMTIEVPAEQVEKEVASRLQSTAKTVRLDGFRPGKVPLRIVQRKFGESVRQEVLGEVMRNSFVDALEQEKISPVGHPRFEPKQVEQGKNLEFVAVVEVFPELELNDFSGIEVEKPVSEVTSEDVDKMMDILLRQQAESEEVDRQSEDRDTITVDYKGSIDGEEFEGGSAEGAKIVLGSGQMIPGFEDGLVGVKAGDEVTLTVSFPEDYHAENLRGKEAKFETRVHKVESPVLPELNEEFFGKYVPGCSSESDFKSEIEKNMKRELRQAIQNKVKQSIVDQLIAANEILVPQAMISQEIDRLKQQAMQQFGGMSGQMKPEDLPSELFKGQAETRIKTGLIFNEIISSNGLKADEEKVREKIEEIASTYEDPEQVISHYENTPEQKSQIEAVVLEDSVIEFMLDKIKVTEKPVSYEEAVKPPAQQP